MMNEIAVRSRWERLEALFLYFFFYSLIGWVYEVFLETIVYQWGFTNRGVLFGPYCPVYGFGALVFLLCFGKLMQKQSPPWFRFVKPLVLFFGCMVVATALELATSYLLEALTGSWPWQTYKYYAIQFQGRIALSPSIRFGLGGVFFLCCLQPLFERCVWAMSPVVRRWCASGLFLLMCADFCTTLILRLPAA